ncbi:MAG: DUF429 domain-containing protein [Candidatus Kapaibacteriales bacterium]
MIVGIDLSAKEHNPTGLCFLNGKTAVTKEVFENIEILTFCKEYKANLIAIDAPLSSEKNRKCDRMAKKYGALPTSMKSMQSLAERAITIINNLESSNEKIIEVFPTGTAKILGIYNKDRKSTMKNLSEKYRISFEGDFSKHQIDSFLSALTGQIWLKDLCVEIGDSSGKIILPNNRKISEISNSISKIKVFAI